MWVHYKEGGSGYTIEGGWEWVHYKGGRSGYTIKGAGVGTL